MVIDLGEDWSAPASAGPAGPARVARWPLVVVAVLALLLPTGSTVVEPGLVPLFRVPLGATNAFALSGDTLYASSGAQVTGYRLGDGRTLWRAPLPYRPDGLIVAGTVVLAQSTAAGTSRTVALDSGTGRPLWTEPAQVDRVLPGSGLAVMSTVSARGPAGLHAVALRTGATVWRGPAAIGTRTVFDLDSPADRPPRVAFWVPDGTVEVAAAATGQVLASARLPTPALGASWLGVAAGRLLVARRLGGGTEFTAYRLDSLAQDWRVTVDSTVYTAAGCGPVLCLYGAGELAGLDPATGAVRWASRVWVGAYPLPGSRLLLTTSGADVRQRVADALTLRPVSDLVPWTPVAGESGAAALFSRRADPPRTWFAVLDGASGRPRLVGSVRDAVRELCVATAGRLACPTGHHGLQIWRFA